MYWTQRLKQYGKQLKRELIVYRAVWADPETPRAAKLLLGLAIGYLMMPFDLIPDFIPILGQLDDVVIIPLLLWLALRCIPPRILKRHRANTAPE